MGPLPVYIDGVLKVLVPLAIIGIISLAIAAACAIVWLVQHINFI